MKRLASISCLFLFSSALLIDSGAALDAQETKPHSAITPAPRGGGWMKRHDSFNSRVAKGSVDLIFIGDSITQGWEGSGRGVWKKYYGKRNTVNLGIGGDRTQHVIWRLENGNLYRIKPKAAVIMIGTNNSICDSSTQIADGVRTIVNRIKTTTPQTTILILAIFPRGRDAGDDRRQINEDANRKIAKLANGKQVHYLDIGDKFLAEDQTLSPEIMPDLLHLSSEGYRIWASSIESSLKRFMGA